MTRDTDIFMTRHKERGKIKVTVSNAGISGSRWSVGFVYSKRGENADGDKEFAEFAETISVFSFPKR